MKIGFISDAHGNSIALNACLDKIDAFKLDTIYFLGDAVGYFPGELEVIQQLRQRQILCQKGNHEAMLLGELAFSSESDEVYRISDAQKRLTPDNFQLIREWPDHRVVHVGGRKLLLAHASPFDYWLDPVLPDSDLSRFSALGYDAVFLGHTHRPFVRNAGPMLVVNVGSCGMPRDQGDKAAFAVYDSDSNTCEILRVSFSVDQVLRHFSDIGIPEPVRRCLERESAEFVGRVL